MKKIFLSALVLLMTAFVSGKAENVVCAGWRIEAYSINDGDLQDVPFPMLGSIVVTDDNAYFLIISEETEEAKVIFNLESMEYSRTTTLQGKEYYMMDGMMQDIVNNKRTLLNLALSKDGNNPELISLEYGNEYDVYIGISIVEDSFTKLKALGELLKNDHRTVSLEKSMQKYK